MTASKTQKNQKEEGAEQDIEIIQNNFTFP